MYFKINTTGRTFCRPVVFGFNCIKKAVVPLAVKLAIPAVS